MEKETYYMICFDSSQRAIHVESVLAAEFADIRLVPIPPEIRVSCGLGIKVSLEQVSAAKGARIGRKDFFGGSRGQQEKRGAMGNRVIYLN